VAVTIFLLDHTAPVLDYHFVFSNFVCFLDFDRLQKKLLHDEHGQSAARRPRQWRSAGYQQHGNIFSVQFRRVTNKRGLQAILFNIQLATFGKTTLPD
jgi:hypothetical protein